ncbi:MAG: hypothetical protein RIC87_20970 [Kiloniellales bacterium]
MMRLEEIAKGQQIEGLTPRGAAEVKSVDWIGSDQLEVIFRTDRGLSNCIVTREDEER